MSTHAPSRLSHLLALFPPPRFLAMPAVGLDISDSSVKFVELVNRPYGKELGMFAERDIPEGVVVNGEIVDTERLARVLAGLRRDFGLEFVRVSLPEEKGYVFQTKIARETPPDQVRGIIEFSLEENVPLSPVESVFDYEVVQSGTGAAGDHVDVNVSVYPRKIVDLYTAAIRRAGLVPLSFEVEAHAVTRAVVQNGDLGTYLIVDIGRARTGLAIVSGGALAFSSTLDVGGDALTVAIGKYAWVSPEKAEVMKNDRGLLRQRGDQELYASLVATVSALRDEINRHYIYWQGRKKPDGSPSPQIQKIVLCGGNANLAGLPEYLSSSLRVPAERANVWVNAAPFEESVPEIGYHQSLSYATAIGLALREEN